MKYFGMYKSLEGLSDKLKTENQEKLLLRSEQLRDKRKQ